MPLLQIIGNIHVYSPCLDTWATIALVIVTFVSLYQYYLWWVNFRLRKSREDPGSMSHSLAPRINGKVRDVKASNILNLICAFKLDNIEHARFRIKQMIARSREKSIDSYEREMHSKSVSARIQSIAKKKLKEATHLNMDHVRISFLQFVWGMLFILPNAFLLGATSIPYMLFRRWISRAFNLKYLVAPHDAEETVAEIVLETTLVIGFLEIHCEEGNQINKRLGRFRWNYIPVINNGDTVDFYDLTVVIDLEIRRFVWGRAYKVVPNATSNTGSDKDGTFLDLCAQDTLVLLVFYLIFAHHVKIHSYANWGINPNCTNAELRTYAVATAMYNYFGKISFADIAQMLYNINVLSIPFKSIRTVIDSGIRSGVMSHFNLHFLKPNESKLTHFITLTRKKFLDLFPKFKDDFKKVQGEALFIGTVIHSLDHTQLQWTVKDPLWLEAHSERFKLMAEVARIVWAGFSSDLPLLSWSCHFRQSEYPLFKEVHEYAARIDRRMADAMDCCIIK